MDEERLVRLVAKGDRAAFEELYRRTSPWMAVRLRRRCADEQIVAEVMQETYLGGVARGGRVRRGGGRRDGRRMAVDDRGTPPRRRVPAQGPPCGAAACGRPAADVAPAAEEEALAATVGGDVGDALRRLAPELRQVLQAMVLDGLSVRETAVLLGLPEGTVKTRARRARIAMREALT